MVARHAPGRGARRGAGQPGRGRAREAIVRFRLPRPALVGLIEARTFDLYDDPMPSLADLEGYCGETSSALIRLASLVLAGGTDPGAADAAGHAGVAYAIVGLLRAFPWHARQGRLYVPADVLGRFGVSREAVVSGRGGPGLAGALAEMRGLARRHLDAARALRATIRPQLAPAFLPAALVPGYLAAMERRGYDPFGTVVDLPQWRRQWRLWRAAWRGGV